MSLVDLKYMPQKLVYIGIFLMGALLSSLFTMSPANAAGSLEIVSVEPAHESTNIKVDQLSTGIEITYQNLGTPLSKTCYPIQGTVTNYSQSNQFPTVDLLDSDGQHIPLYTLSYSDESIQIPSSGRQYSFSLKYAESGFELLPQEQYELRIRGGATGLKFNCSESEQIYQLSQTNYQYKFHTGIDNVAPTIKQITTHSSFNQAVVSWQLSDKSATSKFYYSQSNSNYSEVQVYDDPNLHKIPYAVIGNLTSGENFNFKITSTDQNGNTSDKTGSFTTLDITSDPKVYEITGSSARISWATNLPVKSAIYYGLNSEVNKGSQSSDQNIQHDFRLIHLEPNQTYYFKIQLTSGDYTEVTPVYSFKTGPNPNSTISTEISINPQFTGQFDFSNFNFKDFPLEEVNTSDQASLGAVLASQDSDPSSIAGNFGAIVQQYRWAVWLWVPIALIILLIACVWLLHRHQHRTAGIQKELIEQKVAQINQPPKLR